MRYSPGTEKDKTSEEGRFTPGYKYIFRDGTNYKGSYHFYEKMPYSGASHDENSIRLYTFTNNKDIITFNQLRSFEIHTYPISYYPQPTEKDYDNKSFKRYFVQKRNESKIVEVDKKQYDTLRKKNKGILGSYYKGVEIEWKIVGPKNDIYTTDGILIKHGIEDTNKKTVEQKELEISGFKNMFNNYIEYSKLDKLTLSIAPSDITLETQEKSKKFIL